MADNLRFIQFSHPGREHEPDSGGVKRWNRNERSHARKFMEFNGSWLEEDGNAASGSLRAWGEWEAESALICELNQPYGDSHYPNYLWHPYYVPKDSYRGLHNTDPFIFGERFLYSNCKQRTVRGLARLERGSVIAFGSGRMIGGERKWVLDTVFVVADSLNYTAPSARRELADVTAEAFLTTTGAPLMESEPGSFRLYTGATREYPVEGMFSFFPAMPAHGDTGFPRPVIDLPDEYFNSRSWQAPKGLRNERTSEELRVIWEALVAQVSESGLVLGTHASLPERRMA